MDRDLVDGAGRPRSNAGDSRVPRRDSRPPSGTAFRGARPPRVGRPLKGANGPAVLALRDYLLTLGDNGPSLHVNGGHFPSALLAVDFGQGRSSRPTPDVQDEIMSRMRTAGREVWSRPGSIRVYPDNQNGIWYCAAESS